MSATPHHPTVAPTANRTVLLKAGGIFLTGFVSSCALLAMGFLVYFLFVMVSSTAQMDLHWNQFLTHPPKEGGGAGGISTTLIGTILVTSFMLLFAMPMGVGAAVYWVEYIKGGRLYRFIESTVNNLAGVPSIVYGLFGLGFFVLFIGGAMDKATGHTTPHFGKGALVWASLTLSLLVLPVVMAATEEALKNVPRAHRSAALALGATRWQTVHQVVLPQAMPGILTGAILSVARAAGETAPILFTGAVSFQQDLPLMAIPITSGHVIYVPNLLSGFMEMAYQIYYMVTQYTDPKVGQSVGAATTLVLLATVLGLNATAIVLRYQLRKKLAN